MTIVYAVPYSPPPLPRDPWQGVGFRWVAPGGDVEWVMTSRQGIALRPGVRGLTMPRTDQFTSRLSGGHGQRFRGFSAAPREVFWPLSVWQDAGDIGWLEFDAAFWASLRPDAEGTWVVEHPDGSSRSIGLRLVDDGDKAWDHAPGQRAWSQYGVTLVADDPFWRGRVIVSPVWGQDEAATDFIPAEGAPPFYLSGASTVSSASMSNPGDVEAWPVWSVTGPTSGLTLTVGTDSIGVPFPVLEGQTLVIDTGIPRALLDGVDVTGDLDPAGFAAIPPGASVPLGIVMSGTGTVQASIQPRHYRAWGSA